MKRRNAAAIEPCTASTFAFSWRRQVRAEGRDRGAEQGEDQHPQHHRAFMVSPHARDLVEQRLRRMRVRDHIRDREVRRHVAR